MRELTFLGTGGRGGKALRILCIGAHCDEMSPADHRVGPGERGAVVAVAGEQGVALERRIDGDQRAREDRHILAAQRVDRHRWLR